MRAAIRLRSSINANVEVRDTFTYLRLNKINHCVLIPEGKTYDGMLQKVKDFITWGEVKPEALTNLIIKRGRLTGNRTFDNKYVKDNTKSESIVKYAEAIISGKEIYSELKEVQPVFRLHPPIKGHRAIKKGFKQGGDLGYRGEDINNLIMKMLGPQPATPVKNATVAKAPSKDEVKTAPSKKSISEKSGASGSDAKKAPSPTKEEAAKKPAAKPKKEAIK